MLHALAVNDNGAELVALGVLDDSAEPSGAMVGVPPARTFCCVPTVARVVGVERPRPENLMWISLPCGVSSMFSVIDTTLAPVARMAGVTSTSTARSRAAFVYWFQTYNADH